MSKRQTMRTTLPRVRVAVLRVDERTRPLVNRLEPLPGQALVRRGDDLVIIEAQDGEVLATDVELAMRRGVR